jgi:hypothetical protein
MSNGSHDEQAELARLRRELLSFLAAELAQAGTDGEPHPLSGQIARAIAGEAGTATQAELRLAADHVAGAVLDVLEPALAQRIPALVEPAVAAALAAHEAKAAPRVPLWLLAVMLMINIAAIMLTAVLLKA